MIRRWFALANLRVLCIVSRSRSSGPKRSMTSGCSEQLISIGSGRRRCRLAQNTRIRMWHRARPMRKEAASMSAAGFEWRLRSVPLGVVVARCRCTGTDGNSRATTSGAAHSSDIRYRRGRADVGSPAEHVCVERGSVRERSTMTQHLRRAHRMSPPQGFFAGQLRSFAARAAISTTGQTYNRLPLEIDIQRPSALETDSYWLASCTGGWPQRRAQYLGDDVVAIGTGLGHSPKRGNGLDRSVRLRAPTRPERTCCSLKGPLSPLSELLPAHTTSTDPPTTQRHTPWPPRRPPTTSPRTSSSSSTPSTPTSPTHPSASPPRAPSPRTSAPSSSTPVRARLPRASCTSATPATRASRTSPARPAGSSSSRHARASRSSTRRRTTRSPARASARSSRPPPSSSSSASRATSACARRAAPRSRAGTASSSCAARTGRTTATRRGRAGPSPPRATSSARSRPSSRRPASSSSRCTSSRSSSRTGRARAPARTAGTGAGNARRTCRHCSMCTASVSKVHAQLRCSPRPVNDLPCAVRGPLLCRARRLARTAPGLETAPRTLPLYPRHLQAQPASTLYSTTTHHPHLYFMHRSDHTHIQDTVRARGAAPPLSPYSSLVLSIIMLAIGFDFHLLPRVRQA